MAWIPFPPITDEERRLNAVFGDKPAAEPRRPSTGGRTRPN